MNLGESQWLDELYIDHKPIPLDTIDLIRKSICKIEIKLSLKEEFGTGFFFKYKSSNYLITNEHVVSKDKKSILIEIWDKTKIKINLENRFTLYLQKPKDITVIELEKNEINNVQYLDYDLNYIRGYKQYLNKDVLSIGYPKAEKLSVGSGKIKEINENNNFEFYHNSPTDQGSSGSPIILFHSQQVIGVHKRGHKTKKLNSGTFIFEIFNEIEQHKENKNEKKEEKLIKPNNNIKIEENKNNYNIININEINDNFNYINMNDIDDNFDNFNLIKDDEKISEIKPEIKSDIKEEIKDEINSEFKNEMNCVYRKIYGEDRFYLLHHYQEDFSYDDEEKHKLYLEAKKNINEENIEIYVNNKKIKFTREYKDDENTYSINVKFKFKKLLTSTGWMFYLCHSLQSIDLSSFKGDNITNMCYMFEASGIKKVDFFSVNTSRVTNMRHMFSNCTDLVEVNLCSLDTSNVTNMNNMFSYCIKLKEIDLFSFNTEKVQDMSFMFYEWFLLREVNTSSFNAKNVKDFSCMFKGCPYLKIKNLN